MSLSTKFIIKRKDTYDDDLIIELNTETEGLTIGSQLGNSLLLNHPTVSRLHAGIREFEGSFWLTNLSKSNGTLVNGALIETVQIESDDTIQIGVFLLRPLVENHQLTLEVERQVDSVAAGSKATTLLGNPVQAAAEGKTVRLDPSIFSYFQQQAKEGKTQGLAGKMTQLLSEQGKTSMLGEQGKTEMLSQKTPTGETQAPKVSGKLPGASDTGERPAPRSSGKLPTERINTMQLKKGITGSLTALLSLPENQQQRFKDAIDAFWDRRKQAETGGQKLADKSQLRPVEPDPELVQYNLHLGKKQFNWLPTFDLIRPWPRGYLYVFGGLLVVLSVLAVVIYENAYSPGTVSDPHRLNLAQLEGASPDHATRFKDKLVAANLAENKCGACHAATISMQSQCIGCHTTSHFNSNVIAKHEKANIQCVDCHTEHRGAKYQPAVVARSMCVDCHRDNPTHPKAKRINDSQLLKAPHGGQFGYPITNGTWTWTKPLNPKWKLPDNLGPKEKFHLVHAAASLDQPWKCSGCHVAFTPVSRAKEIDQERCAACHEMRFTADSEKRINREKIDQLAANLRLDCNSCHPQHGADTKLLASLQSTGKNRKPIPFTPEGVYRGGKDWQWTSFAATFGGMTVEGWALLFSVLPAAALGFFGFDTIRRRQVQNLLKGNVIELSQKRKAFADTKYADRWEEPEQKQRAKESSQARAVPHPVINYATCIGCHGCILACPQDVLGFDDQEHHAIVVNYEQCMEDTGCQMACPTVPQSCVLINTKKNIREAPKPIRKGGNDGFETDSVEGVHLVGDVSGVPLIRNAIKEGRAAMDKIGEKLQHHRAAGADYDVAIIGIGPGGISATARAAELGLTYVALEQGRKYSTIADKYPAGKYVAFNPFNPSDPSLGAVILEGPGDLKEKMLGWWDDACAKLNLKINEYEGCKEIVKDGDVFVVKTVKNPNGYRVRKVVLALGNAGEPRKLGAPGEDLPGKVEYRLQDPSAYKGKHIVVVGAGNSAVEAAVDLTGKRQDDGTVQFPDEGGNTVSLVIRSDFPKDLTLENKMWVYYCIDKGRIKAYFGAGVREVREKEVVLEKIRDKSEIATIPNDVVFAMIGSIAPKEFLQKVGIKYAGDDRKKK
ncbi:MAG: NAD(P)-binding domain-containing protein [Blastocatellia bacterium]|nr:NAD(P)-binding domain-containing protein [Blastocatellia bacterium]